MARATSPTAPAFGSSTTGRSISTTWVRRETWMKESPEGPRHLPVDEGDHRRARARRRPSCTRPRRRRSRSRARRGARSWMRATSTGSARERMRPRDLGEEDRHVVGAALVHRLAHVRAGEERAVAEGARVGGSAWSAPPKVMRCVTSTSSSSSARATMARTSSSGLLQPAWIQTWSPERIALTASSAVVTRCAVGLGPAHRPTPAIAAGRGYQRRRRTRGRATRCAQRAPVEVRAARAGPGARCSGALEARVRHREEVRQQGVGEGQGRRARRRPTGRFGTQKWRMPSTS